MIRANKPISYDEPVYIHNPTLLIFNFFISFGLTISATGT